MILGLVSAVSFFRKSPTWCKGVFTLLEASANFLTWLNPVLFPLLSSKQHQAVRVVRDIVNHFSVLFISWEWKAMQVIPLFLKGLQFSANKFIGILNGLFHFCPAIASTNQNNATVITVKNLCVAYLSDICAKDLLTSHLWNSWSCNSRWSTVNSFKLHF